MLYLVVPIATFEALVMWSLDIVVVNPSSSRGFSAATELLSRNQNVILVVQNEISEENIRISHWCVLFPSLCWLNVGSDSLHAIHLCQVYSVVLNVNPLKCSGNRWLHNKNCSMPSRSNLHF